MKIRRVESGGRVRWEIYVGKVGGKRRRLYARTEAEARERVKEIQDEQKDVGRLWRVLSPRTKAEALEVLDEVENAGLTLREVWRHYQHTRGANASQRAELDAARAEFMRSKLEENKRPKYLEMLGLTVERFGRPFPKWNVDEIRVEHVESFLRQFPKPITRQGEHRRLSVFFNWCVARGYCFGNPVARLKVPTVEYGRPKILTVPQCRKLLKAARKDAELVPGLVLMLFAGVRPKEVRRLDWRDVKIESGEVVIDAAADKLRDVRITELPANAVAWLKTAKDRKGPVFPSRNLRKRLEAVRRAAGVDWSHDVLRHTAASFMYQERGAVETSKALGHSERTLFRNYRAQVTKADAEAFYSLRPTRSRSRS